MDLSEKISSILKQMEKSHGACHFYFSDVERYKEKYIRECQKLEDEKWTPG